MAWNFVMSDLSRLFSHKRMLFCELHFKFFRHSQRHNLAAHMSSLNPGYWHDSISNGKARFAWFATCGMLLIFQQLACIFHFSSCCLSMYASGNRRFPKTHIFGRGRNEGGEAVIWQGVGGCVIMGMIRTASNFIIFPKQISTLNSLVHEEFLAGRDWAHFQV